MRILSTINRFIHNLSAILLGVMTTLVILQVFFRYVLEKPLVGSEELARFAMVWLVMIGATVVLRNRTHVGVEYFVELCPESVQKIARIISNLLILIFCIILVVFGYEVTISAMNQISPATRIPHGYIAMSIPLFGLIGSLYMIESLINEFTNKEDHEVKKDEVAQV